MPRADAIPIPFGGELADALATTPRLLSHNAKMWPDAVAVRQKEFGIWQQMTWRQCRDRTRAIALGLHGFGIGADDVVGFIGQNRPDLVFTLIAAHSLGALSLGIYKDSLKEELAHIINQARVRVVIAEDEEQVDKFLELGGSLPSLTRIVYVDDRGMRKYDDSRLLAISELCAVGDRRHAADPTEFDSMVARTRPDAPAILCTTSGTTSHPKLAILGSGRFLRHALSLLTVDPKSPRDDYVSVLPLPWIGEQVNAVAHVLLARIRLNFVEDEETTAHDMREIGPTHILQAPRVWEATAADIKARMMESTPLKRFIFAFAMKLGERAAKARRRSLLGDFLAARALRDRLGLSRIQSATTGGAPLGPDVFQYFRAIGVPLRQVYGQTELIGIHCAHRPDDVDFETVGLPIRGVEMRIDNPDRNGLGEVVVRHPGMFMGYYRDEEATRAELRDGWMHSGDAGYIDGRGHLVVIDRVRDLATLFDGDRFSPQYLENRLKFSPFIGECVVLGQGRPHVAAIICIRHSIVSKWAEARRIGFTTYSDLAARPEVRELLRREVEIVNGRLPEHQRIARMLLLYKELDADDGEVTRTRKLRRRTIGERYALLIEALYSARDYVDVDTTITLQDGRRQRIRGRVSIETLIPKAAAPASYAAAE